MIKVLKTVTWNSKVTTSLLCCALVSLTLLWDFTDFTELNSVYHKRNRCYMCHNLCSRINVFFFFFCSPDCGGPPNWWKVRFHNHLFQIPGIERLYAKQKFSRAQSLSHSRYKYPPASKCKTHSWEEIVTIAAEDEYYQKNVSSLPYILYYSLMCPF